MIPSLAEYRTGCTTPQFGLCPWFRGAATPATREAACLPASFTHWYCRDHAIYGKKGQMTVTNSQSGANVQEVGDGIYRINTPVRIEGVGGFSFIQYLLRDEAPLLFHTGPRKLFPLVREAVASVMPVERLRYIALSHGEADECGSLNDWLLAAPQSLSLCGTVEAIVSIGDLADRAPPRHDARRSWNEPVAQPATPMNATQPHR